MKKSTKKGFTLVELVIVIAVIAILSAILIPTFGNVIENANEEKRVNAVKNAYTEFLSDYNAVPGAIAEAYLVYMDGTTYVAVYKAEGYQKLTTVVDSAPVTITSGTVSLASGAQPAVDISEDNTFAANTLYKLNDNVSIYFAAKA